MIHQHWRGTRSLARIFWGDYLLVLAFLLVLATVLVTGLPGSMGFGLMMLTVVVVQLWSLWILLAIFRRRSRSPLIGRLGASGIVLTVIALPVAMLAGAMYQGDDVRVQARLREAINQASPARIALGETCSAGALRAGMRHEDLGLPAPTAFAGDYQSAVHAATADQGEVRLTIVLGTLGPELPAGHRITWHGQCEARSLHWYAVDGDLPGEVLEQQRTMIR